MLFGPIVRAEQGKAWEEARMTPTKESSKHFQLGGCHVRELLLMLLLSPSTCCSVTEKPHQRPTSLSFLLSQYIPDFFPAVLVYHSFSPD